jgi:UDP-N-acetylmuramate dehydrogenase
MTTCPMPSALPSEVTLPTVREDVALTALNTFGLPARAARLVEIDSVAALQALIASPAWQAGLPRLVLGGGSNLVLTGDFQGLVLKVALRGRQLVREDADGWLVEAAAGEGWDAFVRWTLAQGWAGLENLALIPGTVGAAPIQNIGAYGLEMAERCDSVEVVELASGARSWLAASECGFAYRDSVFRRQPGRWLVSAVRFRLPRVWQARLNYAELARELDTAGLTAPTARQVADAVTAIRRRKLPDPAQIGNAGSFFKNPVVDADHFARLAARWPALPNYPQPDGRYKLAAGWLIDQCGWKGRRLGPVGCYAHQALVLVNHGGACGADLLRLVDAVRGDVENRFGVRLEVEPVFV